MSAAPAEPDDLPLDDDEADDLDDLLPDDLTGPVKKGATPLVRTPKQQAALAKKAAEKAEAESLAAAKTAQLAHAAQLAQIVNLHIAGHSLEAIGAMIGASAEEVDRRLSADAARYVRTQPALRTYVRNFISGKYTSLLESVWDGAVDPNHREQLERQDRAVRILDRMARLHGAEAPTQSEVKVEAAPEAVEKLVNALASGAGLGYNTDIFDVEYTETVHDAVDQSHAALEVSGNAVEQPQEGDENGF